MGHPHPQRRRAGGGQLDRGGAGRRAPRPGDDQRLRRALRQRQHGQRPRQPRAQDRPAAAARSAAASISGADLALAPRGRDRQRHADRLPALRRPLGVRAQGRRPRRRGRQGRAQLPARRSRASSATRAGWSSPSSAAAPTRASAPSSSATSSRASSTRRRSRQTIKELENQGLAFEGAEASFELLIRRQSAGYEPPFRIVDYTALSEQREGRELLAEATVKVAVDGEVLHTAADGNGPVNALDAALRKALSAFYPGARVGPPRRLQGAHPRRRGGDGGAHPGHHRLGRRRAGVVDDGLGHEHHRGVGDRRSPTRSSTPSGRAGRRCGRPGGRAAAGRSGGEVAPSPQGLTFAPVTEPSRGQSHLGSTAERPRRTPRAGVWDGTAERKARRAAPCADSAPSATGGRAHPDRPGTSGRRVRCAAPDGLTRLR